jgi:hypothetical protein
MTEDVSILSQEQLTRLAQYFDERVTSARNYKIHRAQIHRPAT